MNVILLVLVCVAGAWLLLAMSVFFLLFVTTLLGKRQLADWVEVGHDASPPTEKARDLIAQAHAIGLIQVGTYRDMALGDKGANITVFLSGRADVVVVVTARSGFTICNCYSRMADGVFLETGNLIVDSLLRSHYQPERFNGRTLAETLRYHEDRVSGYGSEVDPFKQETLQEDFRRQDQSHAREEVRLGLSTWTDREPTSWRFTCKGAFRTAVIGTKAFMQRKGNQNKS